MVKLFDDVENVGHSAWKGVNNAADYSASELKSAYGTVTGGGKKSRANKSRANKSRANKSRANKSRANKSRANKQNKTRRNNKQNKKNNRSRR